MMKVLPIFCSMLLIQGFLVDAFSLSSLDHVRSRGSPSLSMSSSMFEYEYIPPENDGSHDYSTTLPSVYPDGTPAGMRGEAVRAALRSTQCLAWKLAASSREAHESPNLASGLLRLQGKGALDFLNNKLSNSFLPATETNNKFAQACLLTSKGRLVDTLSIGYADTQAFVQPSPGHAGSALFQKLDPFIFPMDQVQLTDLSEDSCIFTLASTDFQHVTDAVEQHMLPKLKELLPKLRSALDNNFVLPNKAQSLVVNLGGSSLAEDSTDNDCLVVLPHTGMPVCAVDGYTFAFCGSAAQGAGNQVWQDLIGDENHKGPVEVKALEFESLRIEAGVPAFGYEVTGAWKDPQITSPTPLELHQKEEVIDTEKGCYMGQEGIASVLKNPRGPPRSLYSVVFEDDNNIYEHQSEGDNSKVDNLTKMPKAGDKIYVLGSNEEIQVGSLTSVAEPYSTGDSTIVGLALIRRADSILKQMKGKDLQIPRSMAPNLLGGPPDVIDVDSSGIVAPPPLDSLDGLEIIVGGTFTVGMLRGIPIRRFPRGKNMYADKEQIISKQEFYDQGYVDVEFSGKSVPDFLKEKAAAVDTETAEEVQEETEEVTSEAKPEEADAATDDAAAEAEAKRKADKMELLKQKAEAAMARRRQKKLAAESSEDETKSEATENETTAEDAKAAEAKRKAEKMKLLQSRAEEAIARRKKKKEAQD